MHQQIPYGLIYDAKEKMNGHFIHLLYVYTLYIVQYITHDHIKFFMFQILY